MKEGAASAALGQTSAQSEAVEDGIVQLQELTMTRAATNPPRRSDADIFGQARKALDQRSSIPATVRVHIEDGVAWLTGIVRRVSERTEAEDVVRHVPGVQRIVNKITVAQPLSEEGLEPPEG